MILNPRYFELLGNSNDDYTVLALHEKNAEIIAILFFKGLS